MPDQAPTLLTFSELCRFVGASAVTVRAGRETAKVQGVRKGNVILYTEQEAETIRQAVETARLRKRHKPSQ